MSSRSRKLLGALGLFLASVPAFAQVPLRICADPDNLPFSNHAGQGIDQRVVMLIARDLHRRPVFVWARSRRGFLREQFNKNACDVLLGVPVGMRAVAVTMPYYTSSYVFVSRAREHLQLTSFSDSQLNGRRIGLQILEEDLAPPSIPLIRSGHAGQIVGFDSFGRQEGDIVRAVSTGRVGVAVVWGPVAGYFAHQSSVPLTLTPVTPLRDASGIPFAYSIGFGVHKSDKALLEQLNAALIRLRPAIHRILTSYNVPLVPSSQAAR